MLNSFPHCNIAQLDLCHQDGSRWQDVKKLEREGLQRTRLRIGFAVPSVGAPTNHAEHGDAKRRQLLVDAKDGNAAAFYRKHGFIPLTSSPNPCSCRLLPR